MKKKEPLYEIMTLRERLKFKVRNEVYHLDTEERDLLEEIIFTHLDDEELMCIAAEKGLV